MSFSGAIQNKSDTWNTFRQLLVQFRVVQIWERQTQFLKLKISAAAKITNCFAISKWGNHTLHRALRRSPSASESRTGGTIEKSNDVLQHSTFQVRYKRVKLPKQFQVIGSLRLASKDETVNSCKNLQILLQCTALKRSKTDKFEQELAHMNAFKTFTENPRTGRIRTSAMSQNDPYTAIVGLHDNISLVCPCLVM